MVLEAVMGVVLGFLGAVVGLLPAAGTLDLGGMGAMVGLLRSLNAGLPVSEFLAMAAMCLTIYAGSFAYRVLKEVWSWIPFV